MAGDVLRPAIALLAALFLSTSVALAQPSKADTARANALAHEALSAFRQNDWATAHGRFAEAEGAAHSPVFLLYMARAKRNAGELLAARDLYARAAGEVLADDAAAPWKSARADAGKELGELEPRIPSVLIAIRGEPSIDAAVTVDGAVIAAAALRAPIRLNPGVHAIAVTPKGRAAMTRDVRLVEGDAPQKVEFVIAEEAPKAVPPAPPPIVPATPPAPARGSIVPGAVGIGLGAAGLVAGAILGGVAKSTATKATGPCKTLSGGGLDCPVSAKPEIERAQGLATGSNVAFVAGSVLAAAGVVLVIVRPGGDKPTSVALLPGPASLTLRGAF